MDPYSFTIPAGTVFRIPEIRTSLPEACHPRCGELEEHARAFTRPYLIGYFGDEDRADRLLAQRQQHFACTAYPHALDDRAPALIDAVLSSALFDDTFSKPGLQGNLPALKEHHLRWSAVFAGERPPPGADAAYHFAYDTIQACVPYATAAVAQRLRDGWQDVADAFLDEAVRRDQNETVDLDTYATRRVRIHFRQWMAAYLEFALGLDLGRLHDHPLIQSALHHITLHMALANDCYSLVKELNANESTNAIIEQIRHERLDLQSAIENVVELIHQAEQDYLHVQETVHSGPLGDNADVVTYVDALAFLVTGNLCIMQSSSRYHGLDHDGSRVIPGPVTIKHMPTVYTPRKEFPS